MKIQSLMVVLVLFSTTSTFSQSNNEMMQTTNETTINAEFLAEFVLWGDKKLISTLEKLTDEEFSKPFNELSGNIHSKTAHILSIYEFFIAILENRPHDGFPSLDHLTKDELIARWKDYVSYWSETVKNRKSGFVALPPAGNQRVDIQHLYADAFAHTIHHRGQLYTFIRLLGKDKDQVTTKETNLDYFTFFFENKKELIHPAID